VGKEAGEENRLTKGGTTMFSLRTILHTLLVMAAVMRLGTMDAQTVNWVEVESGTPSARTSMGMAYDLATKSTVLFGGANSGTTYGDTWNWRGGWSQLSPATSPSPRYGAGMAYDGAANIVLFGGQSSLIPAGTYLNDTWTWDGTTWTQQFPPVSPSARTYMGMVYDAATKTVVGFGGSNSAGPLGDTWTWNGVTKTWTQQNPGASPSPRGAPMAYDAATQTVVLFGGGNGSVGVAYDDTWTWNGTIWTQQFPASAPPALSGDAMPYDAALGVVVLFGGCVDSIWEDTTNETWIWNGTNWKQIYPATLPPNRYLFGMDYDPVHHDVLMFGGYSSTVVRADTWLLALEP
jgi:hypothetical protein